MLCDQARIALQRELRIGKIRLRLRKIRARLVELSEIRPCVDDVQQIAAIDASAVGECLSLEQAGDLRADLDGGGCEGLSDVLVIDRDRRSRHADDRNFRRRRLRRLLTLAAGCSRCGQQCEHHHT